MLAFTESVPPSFAPVGLLSSATFTVLLADVSNVAVCVFDRDACRPKRAVHGDAGGRLLRDHHLRGCRGSHGDGACGRTAQARCWRPASV